MNTIVKEPVPGLGYDLTRERHRPAANLLGLREPIRAGHRRWHRRLCPVDLPRVSRVPFRFIQLARKE